MLDGNVKNSKYPIGYHITPLAGLLNDPNGLVKFEGIYHVFYQLNPTDTIHKNKHWGHIYSEDLITWHRAPIALAPDAWYDKDGVYSGSAIIIENQLHLYYTGNVIDEAGEKHSYQCLATSEDGFIFEKQGPIFEHPKGFTRHVRDPKVWYDEKEHCYYLVVGAQRENLTGTTLIYRSVDAKQWENLGDLVTNPDILSQIGYMWECPDLVFIDDQAIFIYSPQGIEAQGNQFHNIYQTVYALGEFNEGHLLLNDDMQEIDFGFEYYAPQSFYDGNRILSYGWMGITQPEYEANMPTIEEGWIHCLTIPRELTLDGNKLCQKPAKEIYQLRNQEILLSNGAQEVNTSMIELICEEEVQDDFNITIDDVFTLAYQADTHEITLIRKNWYTNEEEYRKVILDEPLQNFDWFIDGSVSELFVNSGRYVASARLFNSTYCQSKKIEINSAQSFVKGYQLDAMNVH